MKIIRRPAFLMAAALTAGILGADLLLKNNLIFLFKIIFLVELIYFFFYTIFILKANKKSIFTWLTVFFFVLGLFLAAYQEYKYKSRFSVSNFAAAGSSQIIAELIFDIGDLESDNAFLKAHYINGKKVKYGKIIFSSREIQKFKDGDLIFLELELTETTPALNPGSYSYADYLKKQGVYLQGWNPRNIKLLAANRSYKNIIIRVKKTLLENINQLFTEKNADFVKAILLGEREYLNYEQEELLRQAGASHLLAISGLHIGIIILFFSFVLFKIFSQKRRALYILSFLTLIYIIMVGAAVSIIRAALLALLFLWSDEFQRQGDFLNILALTLIVNLLFEPLALFTVSLQLSYILVLSLFYITPLLNYFFTPIFAVSASAQLGSLALIAYYFNEYAYIALITNILVIPYITVLLPFIFIIILLSLLNLYFVQPAVFLIEPALELLFNVLKLMTYIQGRAVVIAEPELIIVILYYLFLFLLPYLYQKRYIFLKARKYYLWQKLIPLFLSIIIISFFITPASDNLVINFMAVGQGDGIFIQFSDGKNMLVDTGPPGSEGRNIEYSIISYLNHLGISSLDYLMISHFDADHAGGIPHLFRRKEVKNIFIPPFKEKTEIHNYLAAETKKKKFKLNFLTAGMSLKIADCRLDILNPKIDDIKENRNDNSIVFLLTHQQNKFLFTGDLSKKGEAKIVKKYDLKAVDVLKVGHHGSKNSSGEILLDTVRPKLAIISVGRNDFGHPSAAVIKRLEEKSIRYLRTDLSGMIKLVSDGKKIYSNTFR